METTAHQAGKNGQPICGHKDPKAWATLNRRLVNCDQCKAVDNAKYDAEKAVRNNATPKAKNP